MKSRILLLATLASIPAAPAVTLLFDLDRTDQQTAGNWNNILRTTTALNSTIDSSGLPSTVGLQFTETFYDIVEPSSRGSENPSGAAGSYPVTATDDYLFGHTTDFGGSVPNPQGQFRLINLEPGLPYTFTFFASRTGISDNREAQEPLRRARFQLGRLINQSDVFRG